MKHLVSLIDLSADDVAAILDTAKQLKNGWRNGHREPILQGHALTQVFEKPSLRTRVSFEAAMRHLGGGSVFLSSADAGLNGRESIEDVARVLTSLSDVVVLRTFSQQLIEDFARYGSCPIINGLSDASHPCQALTDVFTIEEATGSIDDKHLVYVGDGNNVAASLVNVSALMENAITVCTPPGYEIDAEFMADIRERFPKASITESSDPVAAVRKADVVYADVCA